MALFAAISDLGRAAAAGRAGSRMAVKLTKTTKTA
jgi:hypothetical protein